MKISIDTKEDSHEDIKKVINMLKHLVGEHSATNNPNIFGENKPEAESEDNTFSNFFGSQDTQAQQETTEDKQEKDDVPHIIEY